MGALIIKKLNQKTIKRVAIEWIDADASVGWEAHDHACAGIVYTSGYIVYETKIYINVAAGVDFINDHSNGVISIPKVCIKKKRYI